MQQKSDVNGGHGVVDGATAYSGSDRKTWAKPVLTEVALAEITDADFLLDADGGTAFQGS